MKPVKGGDSMWIIYSDGQKRPLEETSKMKWSDQTGTIGARLFLKHY